uniref:Uncharacterized protein n=1 Tax=Sciurus vulgaris TaxID=55149 RepID=A0A8D2DNS1_SCIVU
RHPLQAKKLTNWTSLSRGDPPNTKLVIEKSNKRNKPRAKRIAEAANKKEIDCEGGDIPTEWEAWIRRASKTLLPVGEILRNEKYKEEMKIKSQIFYEKLLRNKTKKEHLSPPAQPQIKGHATHYSLLQRGRTLHGSHQPCKTFQPESWTPLDGKSHHQ